MRRVGVAILLFLLATACGSGTGGSASNNNEGTPKSGGVLTFALESELRTLNPVISTQLVERTVFYQMYESLVTIDDKLNIKPGLATSWNTSSDGLTVTFTLRKGVKFHDGTEFDATAAKFNFDRIASAASSPRKSELANLASAEVKDPQTLVLHL